MFWYDFKIEQKIKNHRVFKNRQANGSCVTLDPKNLIPKRVGQPVLGARWVISKFYPNTLHKWLFVGYKYVNTKSDWSYCNCHADFGIKAE